MRTPTDISPLFLLQERFRSDPWKVLIVCMMLNQTSAVQVKRIVDDFFKRWPEASAVKESDLSEMVEMIASLGFKNRRASSIIKMTLQYVQREWKDPLELFGIGRYASDSYYIFVEGYLKEDVLDKELKKYVSWAKEKHGKKTEVVQSDGRGDVEDSVGGHQECPQEDTGSSP